MPEQSMIEKVARALCHQAEDHPDMRVAIGMMPGTVAQWTLYIPEARAAIEAMREPTDTMLQAWGDADTQSAIENYGRGLDVETGWDIGIDAALEDAP